MGGQPIVYVHNKDGLVFFTKIVSKGYVGGQKREKFCLRSYWIAPYLDYSIVAQILSKHHFALESMILMLKKYTNRHQIPLGWIGLRKFTILSQNI